MNASFFRSPLLGFLLSFLATGSCFAGEILVKPRVFFPEAAVAFYPAPPEQTATADRTTPPSGLPRADHQEPASSPPARPAPQSPKVRSIEENLLLQIFLDEIHFGPGVIDGKIGNFTKVAAQSYYQSIRHHSSDLDLAYQQALAHKSVPLVSVQVPALAGDYVNPQLPFKYREMAKHDKALYRSYLEFMTERYHTSEKALFSFNKASTLKALQPGSWLVVPNVRPFLIEKMEFVRFSAHPSINQNRVVIDTKDNRLYIYRPDEFQGEDLPSEAVIYQQEAQTAPPRERLIASFPITPGRKDQIRFGKWKVKNAVTFPNWRYDPLVLKGTGRSADRDVVHVPPGPNSPVGVLWCGLTARSVGIHGTNAPETIGRTTSSGCIRMANWEVIKVPNFIRPGVQVTIQ